MSAVPKRKAIRIEQKKRGRIFQMRVAGLAFRDGHLLVHRATHERIWTVPGGRAEIGETSEQTLVREMDEELGVAVTVKRLLWAVENFFRYEGADFHEYGLYYLMEIPASFPFHPSGIVHRNADGRNELEFKWVRATKEALTALDIPPYFLAREIEALPESPRYLVWRDGDLD